MRILVQTICYNEEQMLPYFLRHYEQIAEKIIVYDNYSTDFSPVLVDAHPKAELRFFETDDKSHEPSEVAVKNRAAENGRDYDWVIVCDMDEFLWHRRLYTALTKYKSAGITIPYASYYHMIADEFPETTQQIYDRVRNGFRGISKHVLFDPAGVDQMNYGPGCHFAAPTGPSIVYGPNAATWDGSQWIGGSRDGLKVLHMRLLGLEWLIDRFQLLGERKSEYDKKQEFGKQYFLSTEELTRLFDDINGEVTDVFGPVDVLYPNEYFV
jgi:glycosyltransferase involved in cell wall biosynthesis